MFRLATPVALAALAVAAHAGTLKVPQQFETIQLAVDAAAPGDKILIAPGTYVEAVRVPAGLHGLTIQGAGKGVILDGRPLAAIGSGDVLGVNGCDDVTIRNLVVRNAKTKAGGGAFDFGRGIHVIGAGTLLDKCVVINCLSVGIMLEGAGVRAQNCVSKGNYFGYDVTGADAVLTRCAALQSPYVGFMVTGEGATLTKCRVYNSVNMGIRVTGNLARITGCLVVSAGQGDDFIGLSPGIDVSGDGSSVEKNELRGCGQGIRAFGNSGTVISDNELYDIGTYAIRTLGSDHVVEKNQIRGGTASAYLPSIDISSSGSRVRANTIRDAGCDGIYVFGYDAQIEDNRIFDAARTGINVSSHATNAVLVGNETRACAFMGLRNDGTDTSAIGNAFSGSHHDVASSKVFLEFSENSFATGGEDVPPMTP